MIEQRSSGEIVTLTPSPVIDRTYVVDSFAARQVHRAATWREELGGNGVNVSRALVAHGLHTTALIPTLPSALRTDAPSWIIPIPVPVPLRVNTIILEEPSGHTTNVNQRPQQLPAGAWDSIVASTESTLAATQPNWLVVSGALPDESNGEPVRLAPLIEFARRHGARIAVDVPGEWLLGALHPDYPVDVVKPNIHELGQATRMPLRTWGEIIDACHTLRAQGAHTVLLSLGADGMVAVGPLGTHRACSVEVTVRNTTGAGDAALAGFLAATSAGDGPLASVVQAASWGTRAVSSPRSGMLCDQVEDRVLAFPATIPDMATHLIRSAAECWSTQPAEIALRPQFVS